MRSIRLRYDYDPTTTYRARLLPFDAIRREQKINMSIFRRIVVVVSQSNRNYDIGLSWTTCAFVIFRQRTTGCSAMHEDASRGRLSFSEVYADSRGVSLERRRQTTVAG